MALDFVGNQAFYLALARGSAAPLASALRDFPAIPETASLGRFVRNHDELTLDKLSAGRARGGLRALRARSRVPALRPRAAPPAADDARRRPARDPDGVLARLLPPRHAGAVLRRGDRHGREPRDRGPLRRPRARCSGPTTAASPRRTSAAARWSRASGGPSASTSPTQRRDPGSLLNWFERLIRRRRECPELGFGTLTVLDTPDTVLAHRCDWEGATVVAVHELAGKPITLSLEIDDGVELVDLFESGTHPLPATLDLEPYAARWFRIRRDGIRLPP